MKKTLSELHSVDEKIVVVNRLKLVLHQYGPFPQEPVDCILWVKTDLIEANDYNPNVMASSEKKLLIHSLESDGFTQPIVVYGVDGKYIVVDGFHRHLIGKKIAKLNKYQPVACINPDNKTKSCRIAATIRHNRARGKHQIEPMSNIVRDLSRLGWDDKRISDELGMDADEVLRLKQISGIAELFKDEKFSKAWTVK
ncbi:ParB-like nuclease domain-containing protein [Salmonella enterica]|nr:ParB-like nuclease domain-containing protein [Salmonella enterica]HAL5940621.1 ParB-like nuclease domain-containing protein [Escherichia coli]